LDTGKLRRLVMVFGIATLVLIAAAAGLLWHWDGRVQTSAGEALVGGPFTLTNQNGEQVTEKDFAGRYMLI
jgi:protein SCO1/2